MSAAHPAETHFGTITSFLPVTTPWPSSSNCFQTFFAQDGAPSIGYVYAFDPEYGVSVKDTNSPCLPPEATTWWNQQLDGDTGTSIALGPFVCPAAYTPATTTVLNSLTAIVGCCPSGYTFVSLFPEPDPGQCTSALTSGQVITYVSQVGNTYTTTTASPAEVRAVQVNGYIFAAAPSTTSASASSSSTQSSTSSSVSATPTASTIQETPAPGLSVGAKAGLAIGIVVAVTIICFGAYYLIRQYRRRTKDKSMLQNQNQPNPMQSYELQGGRMHEMDAGKGVHELSGRSSS